MPDSDTAVRRQTFVEALADALTKTWRMNIVAADLRDAIATLPDEWNPASLVAENERLRDVLNFWAIPTIAVFAPENSGAKNALIKLREALSSPVEKVVDGEH